MLRGHGPGEIALIAAGLLGTAGCASLPEVRQEMAEQQFTQVQIEGPSGPVAAARSDEILAALGVSETLREHLAFEQTVNEDSPLVLGNRVTLLQNGPATYEAMFAAMRAARDHINLETYIFADDELGERFAALLLEKQAAGVQVNVIYDSVGGLSTPEEFFERLRAAGIRVLEFNPVNPTTKNTKPWLMNNRDHRKQLLVDGRIAFIGGVNISDSYASAPGGSAPGGGRARRKAARAPDPDEGWRDTHVQIEGPVVAQFQQKFMNTWARQKGEPLVERRYFPELEPAGDEIVRAMGSLAEHEESPIYMTLVSAISRAQDEVFLTVAYFAPDPKVLKALCDAARRGADVKLVLPSHTDSWPIFHLGRSYYTKLLKAGVEIYERRGGLMHAKTGVIDGVWSTVGSSNIDWRSFLHNDEINAVVLSRDFAARMEAMFVADLAESTKIELKDWRRRSLWMRLKERVSRIGAYWL